MTLHVITALYSLVSSRIIAADNISEIAYSCSHSKGYHQGVRLQSVAFQDVATEIRLKPITMSIVLADKELQLPVPCGTAP